MPQNSLLQTSAHLLNAVTTFLRPIAALATRIALGQGFLITGLGKWNHFEKIVEFFAGLGIPAPRANAGFVSTLEVVGGACLILGLGTRVFALLLSATLVVAVLTADREGVLAALVPNPPENKSLLDIPATVFLMFSLWLAAFGAGPISLDRLFRRNPETPN